MTTLRFYANALHMTSTAEMVLYGAIHRSCFGKQHRLYFDQKIIRWNVSVQFEDGGLYTIYYASPRACFTNVSF